MASSFSSNSTWSSSGYSTTSSTDGSTRFSLVVAAIDFGTAYSGYAFAMRNDPSQIETNMWNDKNMLSLKTTTSILFKSDKFHSFGMKADKKYAEVLEEHEERGGNELKDWHYFKRFKMQLYRELNQPGPDQPIGRQARKRKITKEMELTDNQGNKTKAFTIFSTAIKFLKDRLISDIQKRVPNIEDKDVSWVLTIPAIWTDAAKQFMRETAIEAGIPNDHLILALEPEAAAIYCKQITIQKTRDGDKSSLSAFLPGEEFLILDMGGGTVDITVSKVTDDGKLKEIETATGGPWGGTKVDENYIEFLKDLFNSYNKYPRQEPSNNRNVWDEFSRQNPSDRFDVEYDFEIKKRNIEDESEYTTIKCPTSLFDKYSEVNKSKLSDDLQREGHKYKNYVKVVKDKLKIKTELILDLFQEPKDQIVEHLQKLFQKPSMSSVKTILMVGGFAESAFLQSEIMKHFQNKRVIIPPGPGIAVLKGAVTYGFDPLIINERKSPRTYGICINVPFDASIHRSEYRSVYDGVAKCENVFQVMVSLGQSLIVGQTVFERLFRPTQANDTTATVEVYESTVEIPMYTTDVTCRRIGELKLDIPNVKKGKDRLIKIKMYFGSTEIFVVAFEEGTSNSIKAKFNCL